MEYHHSAGNIDWKLIYILSQIYWMLLLSVLKALLIFLHIYISPQVK